MLPAGWTWNIPTAGTKFYRRSTHDEQGLVNNLTRQQCAIWNACYPVGNLIPFEYSIPLEEIVNRCRAYCQMWHKPMLGTGNVEDALKELVKWQLVKEEDAKAE